MQRRNQKLLEETPSPGVSEEQRNRIIALAVDAVKQMGYVGVGTLEFLLDKAGNFWFMEMNVRLQVEHCVTEMLVGMDLVKWQIRVAAGIPLNFVQKILIYAVRRWNAESMPEIVVPCVCYMCREVLQCDLTVV